MSCREADENKNNSDFCNFFNGIVKFLLIKRDLDRSVNKNKNSQDKALKFLTSLTLATTVLATKMNAQLD